MLYFYLAIDFLFETIWKKSWKNIANRNKGSAKYLFFLEHALKKTSEYFLKFFFLFESTILPVNNGK